ncbi:MAG: SUMF1/EgtB/PvdO family nonheme iron enzyme [Verrucomicrobia bacterium]|nr:SUMF1/EgtB/PvdO family nonheme iron enzyme [Verrucomicrobiota bacterium]
MRWELEDRIWEGDWTAGDWASLAAQYARACQRVPPIAAEARRLASVAKNQADWEKVRHLYFRSRELGEAQTKAREFNFRALRLAIEDLSLRENYPKHFTARLDALESALREAQSKVARAGMEDFEQVEQLHSQLESLRREALLANPLLNFERLLAIKRKPIGDPRRSQWEDRGLGEFIGLPKQSSWGNATMTKVDNWENEIAVLSPVASEGKWTTLFKPEGRKLVSDVDLHFDGDRLLFSMPDKKNRWQIYELPLNPAALDSPLSGPLRQLTPGDQPEVHCYDACYLPNGKINFISTAVLQGVPCNAGVIVGMMYQMDANGRNIRQICFEQDHDYNPSVLNDGRVVYLRWDYTDTPHVWNRILMSMNPDGTSQMAYYGGSSYWPNAVFFPRAIPEHPTKLAGIVTGHHEGRVGELVIFDPAKGTQETDGVVQRIPGYGKKVEPLIEDKLTEHSWPKLVHPWPLSEKYFLVACKPEPHSLWGIYLVDIFDNMILLKEAEGHVLLEPIPWRKSPAPPVIPDRVQPGRQDALVYVEDVYAGPGLKGIPRGSVKNLRLFTYHFGYQTLAGIDHRVGADGPWETKRVLGTVPVEPDGSAWFRIPAKTPISVQPLDAEGRALALMRSWMTAMPGENLSCVGCHERSHEIPPVRHTIALRRKPSDIQPWRGPARGFSFAREVQPVLDKYCVGCHNPDYAKAHTGQALSDLRRDQGAYVVYEHGKIDGQVIRGAAKGDLLGKYSAVFEPSYAVLRQYVRVGGLESDLHVLPPKEFHADTSELIQMLKKGHHNVQLDAEAWDRLITWIDLNAPCHGTWREVTRLPGNQRERRVALRKLYGGVEEDGEEAPETRLETPPPLMPELLPQPNTELVTAPGWPCDLDEAKRRQVQQESFKRAIDLGNGVTLSLVKIPAGTFVMGDSAGEVDEQPLAPVRIEQPFWMSVHEVSNEQFARFDSSHDSRFEHRSSWIFSEEYLGWPLNRPRQPVVRVSWQEAMAFCRWLSGQLGENVTLPTEAQWEYACRAGTATPLFYGGLDTDFSPFANLGDSNLRKLAAEGWRPKAPDLVPRDDRFDDRALVTVEAGRYRPNAWGLHDMHGNAAEWTRTVYRPYPYRTGDGRDAIADEGLKVVRGGSWRDRPARCRSAFRLSYPAYQKVFNVGFRVVIESSPEPLAKAGK